MTPPFPPESWLRDVDALRRVARSLLDRDADVDDAVQGVALTALQSPPRAWSRAWLLSVLRRGAIDQQRAESRRRRLHARLEPPDPAPAGDEIVARLEAHEHLAAAIRALPSASREAIWLRFFDGLPPREIAVRLAIPVKTVKSRLHRALQELRARLEADGHRDASDWRSALTEIALPAPALVTAAPPALWILGGIDTMKRLVIVLALCLGLWGLWELTLRPPGPVGPGGPGTPPAVAEPRDATARPAAAGATPGAGGRTEVADQDRDRRDDTASDDPTRGTLVVHVFWHDGAAASAIGVALSRGDYGSYEPLARLVTDATGATAGAPLPPGTYRLRTLWDVHAPAEVRAGETTEVRIDLPQGVEVAGEVVDGEGRPVPHAAIWMQGTDSGWTGGSVATRADAAGRFELRSAPKGISLGALAAGFAPSALVDLDLVDTSAPPARVRLVLDAAGGAARGTVRDARGEPVAGAVVCIGDKGPRFGDVRPNGSWSEKWSPPSVRTDAEGAFALDGLPLGALPVAVRSAHHPIWNGTVEVAADAPATVAITLDDPAVLKGVVTDGSGAPIARAVVHVFPVALDPAFLQFGQLEYEHVFGHEADAADAEGRYRIDNVAPGAVHAYAFRPADPAARPPVVHAETTLEAASGAVLAWDPVLSEGHIIEGVVLYRDGTPMPDAFVTARDETSGTSHVVTTDRDGRFRFVNLDDHVHTIGVQVIPLPDGADPVGKRGLRPDEGEVRIVATFDAPRELAPGRVTGRIDDQAGVVTPPRSLGVVAWSGRSWWSGDATGGDRFAFPELPPGHYVPVVSSGENVVLVGDAFDLAPGQELDLGTLVTAPLGRATLRIVRDAAARDRPLKLLVTRESASRSIERELSAESEVVLDRLAPGTHRVYVHGDGIVRCASNFVVAPGGDTAAEVRVRGGAPCPIELDYPPDLDLGRLRLTVLDADGEDVWTTRQGSAVLRRPFVTRPTLPLGHFRVVVETSTGKRAEAAFEVTSVAGGAPPVRVELR